MGPSGMSGKVAGWLVPSVQKIQTGAVNDYALLLQIFIVLGLLLLAYPVEAAATVSGRDTKT